MLARKRLVGLFVLLALLFLGIAGSIVFGSRPIPLSTFPAIINNFPAMFDSSAPKSVEEQVVFELRVPRTFLALLAGAALGVAGALIQGHTRNPLADPGILGINAGAALAVVLSSTLFSVTSMWATSLWAFSGAIAATAAVFALATIGKGSSTSITLVLGGAALASILTSITSAFILTDNSDLNRMRFWTVGSVAGRDMSIVYGILPFVTVGLVVALMTGPQLNALNLGDDIAASLGINTRLARITGMALIAVLAGAATAGAGPLGFIGLIVPHAIRTIVGPDYRWILPYSALAGAVLLLAADVAGRLAARPAEMQVGIVLAFIGAPLFIALIVRRKTVKLS